MDYNLIYFFMIVLSPKKIKHCFCYLRMSYLYVQMLQVLCHVALPCFYSGPQQTNCTLALDMVFHSFCVLCMDKNTSVVFS